MNRLTVIHKKIYYHPTVTGKTLAQRSLCTNYYCAAFQLNNAPVLSSVINPVLSFHSVFIHELVNEWKL